MNRFSNLEFEDDFQGFTEEVSQKRDEAFFLNEARRGWEHGKFEYVLRAYAKALEFNPSNSSSWAGQVRALIELNELREAKIWADKALEKFPNDSELLAGKAVTLARLGDYEAALAFADAAMENQGNSPIIWLSRGDVLMSKKEKFADYSIDKAVYFAYSDWFIYWMASRIYYYYQQFSKAFKYAKKSIELNPEIPVCWHQIGLCQIEMGMAEQARQSCMHALELSPGNSAFESSLNKLNNKGFISRFLRRLRSIINS